MTDFIVVGNANAVTYKEVFTLIKDNKVRLGYNTVKTFNTKDGTKDFGNIGWFSTFPVEKEPIVLSKVYTPEKYPVYDNYDAINIDRIKDIPYDYDGVMGVPITYLDKHNPNQFEIVGLTAGNIRGLAGIESKMGKDGPYVNGKLLYGRILIRKVKEVNNNLTN